MRTLGIVGGGQLGRMLALEAKRLGFTVIVIDPTPGSPAGQVADDQIVAGFDDMDAIRRLADESDYITFEIESANASVLEELQAGGAKVNPSPRTLETVKDKMRQKLWLRNHGVAVADFEPVDDLADAETAAEIFGYPFLLKSRFGAYDGRGNAVIASPADIRPAIERLGSQDLYAERWVPFKQELAVIVARDMAGNTEIYPVVETVHKNNICHQVYVPARSSEAVSERALTMGKTVAAQLAGAGVFAIELFVTPEGEVLVNEIAPRVHNSGHATIEAAVTSQFEQQVRAVTGLPLGSTSLRVPAAVMINILGERSGPAEPTGLGRALSIPGVRVHLYGKADTRPERKMGHITAVADSIDEAEEYARAAREALSI